MAGAPEKVAFIQDDLDFEEGFSDSVAVPEGRTLRRRCTGRSALTAAFVATALVAASAACVARGPLLRLARVSGATLAAEEELVKPFKQCGGAHYTNSTCCVKGCACVKETQYYSQCKPPEGLQHCNHQAAVKEVDAAKERVVDAKIDVKDAKSDVEAAKKAHEACKDANVEAHKKAVAAAEEADKKHKLLEDDIQKFGKNTRAVKQTCQKEEDGVRKTEEDKRDEIIKGARADLAQTRKSAKETKAKHEKDVRDAKAKADDELAKAIKLKKDTAKAEAAKAKEEATVAGHVKKFEDAEKVRKEKKCGGLFGDCTGTGCCVLGCECHWDTKFYAQCKGSFGAGSCVWQIAVKKQNESATALPILKKQLKKLKEEKHDTAQAAKDAAAKAKKAGETMDKTIAVEKVTYDKILKEAKEKADKIIADAREKCDATIKVVVDKNKKKTDAAQAKEDVKTADARHAFQEADKAKKAAEAVEDKKQAAQDNALKHVLATQKALQDMKSKLVSANWAVGTWKKAAKGDTCGP
mmetsp:Transcript_21377/g.61864  ORF Transcript_21377/g.61864 Transcript_21377/m.61864 type:complete len:525 (-) Transcript_21377:79-1653(-)